MGWFPKFSVGRLNGWILLVIHGQVLGTVVRSFPQEVTARLYDKSSWTRQQRVLTTIGRVFSSVLFSLLASSPLRIGQALFVIGMVVFALGMIGLVIALVNFESEPPGQPASERLCRVSRNPQWMMLVLVFPGQCLAIGSCAVLLLFAAEAVCYHFRILVEEPSCLALYGDGYRDCGAHIPGHVLFF